MFGPYVTLPAGPCVARIIFQGKPQGRVLVDFCAESGGVIFASRQVDLGLLESDTLELPAILERPYAVCEVRLLCEADVNADILSLQIEIDQIPASFESVTQNINTSIPFQLDDFAKQTSAAWLDAAINSTSTPSQNAPMETSAFLLSLDRRLGNGMFWSEVAFLKSMIPNCRILDVGCGNNSPFNVKNIRPDCYYTGIDVGDYNQSSPELADKYIITDPNDFADEIMKLGGRFDAVISTHNIEHCNDRNKTMEAMLRALRPGGQLYMLFPSEISHTLPSRGGGLNYHDDGTHQGLPPDFDEIVSAIKSIGARIVFSERQYRPLHECVLGLLNEPDSVRRNTILPGTWSYYGFEAMIWAKLDD